ncbi:MAG: flagellar basal body-associated FliL family protein [Acidithiobacillus sp.]|nr:flagellar basal body-associated FliL family protein [Acidithiobacillus sp.]
MKKKWILVVVVVLLLLNGGVGAWWYLHGSKKGASTPHLVSQTIAFDHSFVTSVMDPDGSSHYLVIELAAVVSTPKEIPLAWIKAHQTELRSSILSAMLNTNNLSEVTTQKNERTILRNNIASSILPVLKEEQKDIKVNRILFTKLLLQ